jgi:uncharacterized membrane protein
MGPPGTPYGAPPAGGSAYSPVDAVKYGWARFTRSPGTMLVPVLVVVVAVIALEVIAFLILNATLLGTHDCTTTVLGQRVETQCGPGFLTQLIGSGLAGLVVSFIAQLLGAGLIKVALDVADGKETSTGEVFAWAAKPKVVAAALIVALATFVGTLLCYLPGIVVGFLLVFTMFFVVDRDMEPMEAVRASIRFTTSHLGETVLFYLLGIVVLIVGAILCGVGLLVAVPVVLLGAAYTYRTLHGQPVAPVEA